MSGRAESRLKPAALPQDRPTAFVLAPDAEERSAIARRLDLDALRKLGFRGTIRPEGRADWVLEAALGATVVQPCVVTLAPVTTRIDETVTRRYLARMPAQPEAEEVEMPQDETVEPLPETIDLAQVMEEALALALPAYPRADAASLGRAQFAGPGVAPLSDEDVKPFAGLAGLKRRLQGDDDDGTTG